MRTPNYNPLYSRGGQQDEYQRVPSFVGGVGGVGGVVNSVNSGQVVDSGGVNGVNGWPQQKGGILRVGATEVSAVSFWNSVAVGVHFVNALSILVLASANERNPVYHLTYEGLYYTRTGNSGNGSVVFAGDTDVAVTIDTSVLPSHKFGPDITVYATLLQSETLAVSVPGVVVAFFTLSAVFQGLYTNSFRFVEYSFSASIMVLLMMLQVRSVCLFCFVLFLYVVFWNHALTQCLPLLGCRLGFGMRMQCFPLCF